MFEDWFCWHAVPESRDCDSDWEMELSGEVESDDEELKEDERAREPGMLTGADPTSTLWPEGQSTSSWCFRDRRTLWKRPTEWAHQDAPYLAVLDCCLAPPIPYREKRHWRHWSSGPARILVESMRNPIGIQQQNICSTVPSCSFTRNYRWQTPLCCCLDRTEWLLHSLLIRWWVKNYLSQY